MMTPSELSGAAREIRQVALRMMVTLREHTGPVDADVKAYGQHLRELCEIAHKLSPLPIEEGTEVTWRRRAGHRFKVHRIYGNDRMELREVNLAGDVISPKRHYATRPTLRATFEDLNG